MDETYSLWTCLVYVFNLIVGTGALTLPAAVSGAGWLNGALMLSFLALVSYVTVTFVVEAMATSNALTQWRRLKHLKRINQEVDDEDASSEGSSEDTPLCHTASLDTFPCPPVAFYSIDEKFEMGQMARLYFPKTGQVLFFSCFCLYLFGDLAIYSAAVSKSLVDVICAADRNSTLLSEDESCFTNSSITQKTAYKLFLGGFLILFGPFVFFNVQKTKYLQILTSMTRWLAFSIMIALATVRLFSDEERHGAPVTGRLSGVPGLFGPCVYSFMCHHSLPSLVTPVRPPKKGAAIRRALAADYTLILAFYLTLALTGVFAFPSLQELYTLNFVPKRGDSALSEAIDYFLALFPVFTLSTSFPVIAVTLRSNLQALLSPDSSLWLRNILVPAFGVVAPVSVAMAVEDVNTLVRFTGSYAGAGIQYLIPAFLVIAARANLPPELARIDNEFASPFRSAFWPVLVICWSAVCISFVSINYAKSLV